MPNVRVPRRAACAAALAAVLVSTVAVAAEGPAPTAPGAAETVPPGRPKPLSLAECLAIARERALDFRQDRIAEMKSRLDVRSARAAFSPTATTSLGWDDVALKESVGVTLVQPTPWGATLSASADHWWDPGESYTSVTATLAEPLLRGAGLAQGLGGVRAASARGLAARERLERGSQELVYRVKSRYFDVQSLTAVVVVREEAVTRARRLVEEAEFKLSRGAATVLDHANAVIQLADREAALVSAHRRLADSLDLLKETLGADLDMALAVEPAGLDVDVRPRPGQKAELAVDAEARRVTLVRSRLAADGSVSGEASRVLLFESARPPGATAAGLVKLALERRPDAMAAARELDARLAEAGAKRSASRHELDLTLTHKSSGTGDASSESVVLRDDGWTAGISWTWPVGRLRRWVDAEKARLDVEYQEIALERKALEVAREVRSLTRRLEETEMNALNYARKVSAAARAVESVDIRRERGEATYWELSARESDLLDAQTSFISACLDYRKALAEFDLVTGAP